MTQSRSFAYPIEPNQPQPSEYNSRDTLELLSTSTEVTVPESMLATLLSESSIPSDSPDHAAEKPPFVPRTAAEFWAMIDALERRE